MYAVIYNLLSFVGLIGLSIGMYKYCTKNEKIIANKILAYSYFILALSDVMKQSYGMMIFCEIFAVNRYIKYINEKGAK